MLFAAFLILVMKRRASDKEILLLIEDYVVHGKRQAYDELVTLVYRDLQKNIYYTLKKFDKSTAEEYIRSESADLCHDFLLDKFEHVVRTYQPVKGSFWTWLFRCSDFYAIDHLRKKSARGREEPMQVDEEEWKSYYVLKEIAEEAFQNPHHEREQTELLEVIHRYVERLPEHYRNTVKLRLEGLSDNDIAKKLKMPVGTIKSHYSRAKQILRDWLKADGYL